MRAASSVAVTQETDDAQLRNDLFWRQIQGISVDELVRYPNIGPVTAAKLRSAGLKTVAICSRYKLATFRASVPARAADLTVAINQVLLEAKSRFEAGASTEGAEYKKAMTSRRAEFEQRRIAADTALHVAESFLATLRERARIADHVTFVGYLLRRQPPGLTVEIMNQPLVAGPTVIATPVTPPIPPMPSPLPTPNVEKAAASATLRPPPKPIEVTPLERMRAVIAFGLAMAKADGRIAAAERKQVRVYVERRFTVVSSKIDSIITDVEGDVPTLGDALWQIKRVAPEHAWPEIYQFAVSVADSAGEHNARN